MRHCLLAIFVWLWASQVRGEVPIADEYRVSNVGSNCWWACADTIGRATQNPRLTGILSRVLRDAHPAEIDGAWPSEIHARLTAERIPVIVDHRCDYRFLQAHVSLAMPVLATIWIDPTQQTAHAVVILDLVWKQVGQQRRLFVRLFDPNLQGDQEITWEQFRNIAVPIAYTFPAVVE